MYKLNVAQHHTNRNDYLQHNNVDAVLLQDWTKVPSPTCTRPPLRFCADDGEVAGSGRRRTPTCSQRAISSASTSEMRPGIVVWGPCEVRTVRGANGHAHLVHYNVHPTQCAVAQQLRQRGAPGATATAHAATEAADRLCIGTANTIGQGWRRRGESCIYAARGGVRTRISRF